MPCVPFERGTRPCHSLAPGTSLWPLSQMLAAQLFHGLALSEVSSINLSLAEEDDSSTVFSESAEIAKQDNQTVGQLERMLLPTFSLSTLSFDEARRAKRHIYTLTSSVFPFSPLAQHHYQ